MREAELEEMETKWKAENERIMREHPQPTPDSDWSKPSDEPAPMKPKAPPAPPGAAPPIPSAGAAPPAPPPGEPG